MSFTRTVVKITLITGMVGVLLETLPGETDSQGDLPDTSEEDTAGLALVGWLVLLRVIRALRLPQVLTLIFKSISLLIIKLYDLILVLLSPLTFPLSLIPTPTISHEAVSLTWLPLYQFFGGTVVVGAVIGLGAIKLST